MYPIKCAGGFSIPTKGGKFKIVGVCAAVADPTATAQIALVDDENINLGETQGYVLGDITNSKFILVNLKGIANESGNLEFSFPCDIKTRYGLSAYFDNLVPGSICVYEE
jgi:hypothetical protein